MGEREEKTTPLILLPLTLLLIEHLLCAKSRMGTKLHLSDLLE